MKLVPWLLAAPLRLLKVFPDCIGKLFAEEEEACDGVMWCVLIGLIVVFGSGFVLMIVFDGMEALCCFFLP